MPNFANIGRKVPEIWQIFCFQDGGRPPSWICFTRVGTTHEEYLVVFVTVKKFGCNRRSNFDSMQILIFCALSLKMPIHAPKIGGLGFYPQNGEQYERDPHKAHDWAETRRMTYRSSKSVHLCRLAASRRIKQKIKNKKGIPTLVRNHTSCFFHPRCRIAT